MPTPTQLREAIDRANVRLAREYRDFSVGMLRWDWSCNISQETRRLIAAEVRRREMTMESFKAIAPERPW